MKDLFAWCIVPYDSKARTPEERIKMLKELGFTSYAYDWREKHLDKTAHELRLAKENGIPFYVAAPISTFDNNISSGNEIIIEERDTKELSEINGKKIMPSWIKTKNPAFDITPKKYVTAYITEKGIIKN